MVSSGSYYESKRGDNAYLVKCESYKGQRHYAVCQHVLERIERNLTNVSDRPCAIAVRTGNCPALKMLMEERSAKKALYYTKREGTSVVPASERVGRSTITRRVAREASEQKSRSAPISRPTPPKPRPKPASEAIAAATSGNIYADLVNRMLAESRKEGKR